MTQRLALKPLREPISGAVQDVLNRMIARLEEKGYKPMLFSRGGQLYIVGVKAAQPEHAPELAGVGEES